MRHVAALYFVDMDTEPDIGDVEEQPQDRLGG
jgi:hypothetical protein